LNYTRISPGISAFASVYRQPTLDIIQGTLEFVNTYNQNFFKKYKIFLCLFYLFLPSVFLLK